MTPLLDPRDYPLRLTTRLARTCGGFFYFFLSLEALAMPHRTAAIGKVSHAKGIPASALGLRVSGDLGPWTIWTDRFGRKQFFFYTPPTTVPTPAQAAHRARFRWAQAAWSALSDSQKAALESAVRATSLCLTGQNLWISALLRRMPDQYYAVGRQAGITLPDLPVEPEP